MSKGKQRRKDVLQRLTSYVNNTYSSFTYNQLLKSLRITDGNDKQKISTAIEVLIAQGRLTRTSDGKLKPKRKGFEVVGRVDMTGSGFAFVECDDCDVDIFIPPNALNTALHGDLVRVFARETRRRPEGEIIEILERARSTFAGVLSLHGKNGFVDPDSRHMHTDIFIPGENMGNAQDGDKVLVAITEWPTSVKGPVGEITDILGKPGENNAEMHAILAEYGLPYKFEKKVEDAAEKVADDIESELPHRRDFRDIITLTIDPKDAKDFDDALSIRNVSKNKWEVGVHIADVTHYVTPGSIIDKEAVKRATSVYLVDRTVSMLPERLSNGLCSLRPNEEKLCFSVVFEMDKEGNVLSKWFGKTVIKSDNRFTYEEVQDIIDCGKGNYGDEILRLHDLAQKLRAERFKNGSVGFERAEARFDIDKDGRPIGVYFREDSTSHQLIEEFMLLANRSVAERVGKVDSGKKAKTFVYRIHDKPNEQKLENFGHIALQFGHKVSFSKGKNVSKELNRLLTEIKGTKEENLLETLALRSMAKAIYSTNNIGHYGLAFDYYTHFTSPIRRYPDMMVHRLLLQYLNKGKSANEKEYEELCKHSSQMEQLAADAERASIKYKMAEYMQDKIGFEFDGIISGVTDKGIYVEINENKIEGMVLLRTLK
ncbi:MAG: ribonuclease R, partial [Prevotellaceae bacterium]|nr:ribonuclease R [Prevotellaceae bacterium]